jgi:membrane-bound metal-dependent hydrolase YbcI (DUF457 family)
MDPITHGITGALLGKGLFSKRQARVSIFAATLGAVFPDVDVFFEFFSRDPLAIVKYHRAITHSFAGLPFFAAFLAWLTRRVARHFGIESPSWLMLTLIYGVGIASHIILDGMTSFGTRMWMPFSEQRVSWDLLFIIDFTFTAIVLLPQIAAWVYSGRENSRLRAGVIWILLSLGACGAYAIGVLVGHPFGKGIVVIACAAIAALLFLPSIRGWGFGVPRAGWCQAGACLMLLYLFACAAAHHSALNRAKEFAAANHIAVVRMAAIPVPPSLLDWGDEILTPDGVYQTEFDLREPLPPVFRFFADSPPDEFTTRALQLPAVQLYWQFARFPVIRTSYEGTHHIVQFGERRFVSPTTKNLPPFTYQVVFDAGGNVIRQGWFSDALQMRRSDDLKQQSPEKKAP